MIRKPAVPGRPIRSCAQLTVAPDRGRVRRASRLDGSSLASSVATYQCTCGGRLKYYDTLHGLQISLGINNADGSGGLKQKSWRVPCFRPGAQAKSGDQLAEKCSWLLHMYVRGDLEGTGSKYRHLLHF